MIITPSTIFSNISTLADLINNFMAVDVVGIFDNTTLNQVFFNARPMKAEVRETSIVMKHPVETGTVLSDNHIINPVEINITIMIKSEYYNSVYSQIKQAFIAATLLLVQTRTGIYQNMIIANMPHVETSEEFDAIIMTLNLVEVLYIVPTVVSPASSPANYSPSDVTNSNTVQAGLKYGSSLSSSNATAVQSIFTGLAFKTFGGF